MLRKLEKSGACSKDVSEIEPYRSCSLRWTQFYVDGTVSGYTYMFKSEESCLWVVKAFDMN